MKSVNVASWLMSRAGWSWSRETFDDATECHDIIEITDEGLEESSAAQWERSERGFRRLVRWEPGWADVEGDPDSPPERA